jgi:hypothetical protein
MSTNSIQSLNEIKALFRCQCSEWVKHNDYTSQIAPFTSQVRLRHLELWKQLNAGLETGHYDFYLGCLGSAREIGL